MSGLFSPINKFITAIVADGRLSDMSSILNITQGGQGAEDAELEGDEEGEGEELTASALLNIATEFP